MYNRTPLPQGPTDLPFNIKSIADFGNIPLPPLEDPLRSRLRNGLDIALDYLNSDGSGSSVRKIKKRAMSWTFNYCTEGQTRHDSKTLEEFVPSVADHPTFKDMHPDIFNVKVQGHKRFRTAELFPSPRPEAVALPRSPRRQRAQRGQPVNHDQPIATPDDTMSPREESEVQTERFPDYVEATLAYGSEMDDIINLWPQQTHNRQHVTAEDLRHSALMKELPEFIAQLAKADLPHETRIAEAKKTGGATVDSHRVYFSRDEDADSDDENDNGDPSNDARLQESSRITLELSSPGGQDIDLDMTAESLTQSLHEDQGHGSNSNSHRNNAGVRKVVVLKDGVRIGSRAINSAPNTNSHPPQSHGDEATPKNNTAGVKTLILLRGGVHIGSRTFPPLLNSLKRPRGGTDDEAPQGSRSITSPRNNAGGVKKLVLFRLGMHIRSRTINIPRNNTSGVRNLILFSNGVFTGSRTINSNNNASRHRSKKNNNSDVKKLALFRSGVHIGSRRFSRPLGSLKRASDTENATAPQQSPSITPNHNNTSGVRKLILLRNGVFIGSGTITPPGNNAGSVKKVIVFTNGVRIGSRKFSRPLGSRKRDRDDEETGERPAKRLRDESWGGSTTSIEDDTESPGSNSNTGSVKKLILFRRGVRIGSRTLADPLRPVKRTRSEDNDDRPHGQKGGEAYEIPLKRVKIESGGRDSDF